MPRVVRPSEVAAGIVRGLDSANLEEGALLGTGDEREADGVGSRDEGEADSPSPDGGRRIASVGALAYMAPTGVGVLETGPGGSVRLSRPRGKPSILLAPTQRLLAKEQSAGGAASDGCNGNGEAVDEHVRVGAGGSVARWLGGSVPPWPHCGRAKTWRNPSEREPTRCYSAASSQGMPARGVTLPETLSMPPSQASSSWPTTRQRSIALDTS